MGLRTSPRIAVVRGGSSAEAEVSRTSGRCVAEALRASFAHVEEVELDPRVAHALEAAKAEVVFPALHGPQGEDGSFQGMLEVLGLPYVGSGVRASACALDKVIAKQLFRAAGLPLAREAVIERAEGTSAGARRVAEALGLEVVVKPSSQGSAIGVLFTHDLPSLEKALDQAFAFGDRALVEERIRGREVTCAVLERERAEALPVIEIRTPKGTWYDYEHRYAPGLSEHVIPAPLPEPRLRRIQEVAVAAHQALGCRDLSRADFVVPERGEPIVLEVNTLPGMTPTSLYPDACRAIGMSFESLVAHLVDRAWSRRRGAGA
jgi:D-alanine-D-alanine ligase